MRERKSLIGSLFSLANGILLFVELITDILPRIYVRCYAFSVNSFFPISLISFSLMIGGYSKYYLHFEEMENFIRFLWSGFRAAVLMFLFGLKFLSSIWNIWNLWMFIGSWKFSGNDVFLLTRKGICSLCEWRLRL